MKTETQHTPGPWKTTDDIYTIGIEGPNGETVATCGGGLTQSNERDWADARLIAAAPETAKQRDELLAAAKAVYDDFDIQAHGGIAINYLANWNRLSAAISRAEKGAS